MKKILFFMAISLSILSAINVQKASKDELMCIKGIGEKKASSIMKYRKSHNLKSADDLLDIKGFGPALVKNVRKDIKSVACSGKKSSKKSVTKKKKEEKKKKAEKKNKKSSDKNKSSEK